MARPKGKRPSVRLSVSLDANDHAELARLAEEHDLSVSWIVRKAVTEFVEFHKDEDQQQLPLSRGALRAGW